MVRGVPILSKKRKGPPPQSALFPRLVAVGCIFPPLRKTKVMPIVIRITTLERFPEWNSCKDHAAFPEKNCSGFVRDLCCPARPGRTILSISQS